jgi:hypothetical protein
VEEAKDFDSLSFDEQRNTFEVDVTDKDTAYDHPLPYETPSDNGADSNSDYERRIRMSEMCMLIKVSRREPRVR